MVDTKVLTLPLPTVGSANDRAIQLLDESEDNLLTEDPIWIENTQQKVDLAIDSLAKNGDTDGIIVIDRLLEKFCQARQSSLADI